MVKKIERGSNLYESWKIINDSIDQSNAAKTKSDQASSDSAAAKTIAENTDIRLANATIEGDSSVEAAESRLNGVTQENFNTLPERLDSDYIKWKNEFENRGINIKWYEDMKVAVSEGYDWQPAIEQALQDAKALNKDCFVPPEELLHSNVIKVPENTSLYGLPGKSTLKAITPDFSSLSLEENGALAFNLVLDCVETTRSPSEYRPKLMIKEAQENHAYNIKILRSAGIGVMVKNASKYKVHDIWMKNTLADGVHQTNGCKAGFVDRIFAFDVADDGVAVVSYADQTNMCEDISISNIYVERGGARGVSIVGGKNIKAKNISSRLTSGSTLYIASEASYNTYGCENIVVDTVDSVGANTYNASSNMPAIYVNANNFPIKNIHLINCNAKEFGFRGFGCGGSAGVENLNVRGGDIIGEYGIWETNVNISNTKDLSLSFINSLNSGTTGIYIAPSCNGKVDLDHIHVKDANQQNESSTIDGITCNVINAKITFCTVEDNNGYTEKAIESNKEGAFVFGNTLIGNTNVGAPNNTAPAAY